MNSIVNTNTNTNTKYTCDIVEQEQERKNFYDAAQCLLMPHVSRPARYGKRTPVSVVSRSRAPAGIGTAPTVMGSDVMPRTMKYRTYTGAGGA
jgi:hypothetical protein